MGIVETKISRAEEKEMLVGTEKSESGVDAERMVFGSDSGCDVLRYKETLRGIWWG